MSGTMATGGVTEDESRPPRTSYEVKFDLSRVAFGEPLLAVIRAGDGRVWSAAVVSQGGAPAIQHLIGGTTANSGPPPSASLRAIHAELVRLFEHGEPQERLALQAVGFVEGVKRPTQPGKPPDSHHNLAVRANHVHENGGVDRASATERDAYKRARIAKIVRRGSLTDHGSQLLAAVEAAKADVVALLGVEGEQSDDELRSSRNIRHSSEALQAALTDLELRGEIRVRVGKCASCGKAHTYYALVE